VGVNYGHKTHLGSRSANKAGGITRTALFLDDIGSSWNCARKNPKAKVLQARNYQRLAFGSGEQFKGTIMTTKLTLDREGMVRNLAEKLMANISQIRYGTCAVVVTVHQSRPVCVKVETTEKTTQKEEVQNECVVH